MKIVRIKRPDGSYENNYMSGQKYTEFLFKRLNQINQYLDSAFFHSVEIESILRDAINLRNQQNFSEIRLHTSEEVLEGRRKIVSDDYLKNNTWTWLCEKQKNSELIENLKAERSKAILELGSKYVYEDNSGYEIASYVNTSIVSINSKKLSQKLKDQVVIEFDELE